MLTYKGDGSIEHQDHGCQTKSCNNFNKGSLANCAASFQRYVKCKERTHLENPPVTVLKREDR